MNQLDTISPPSRNLEFRGEQLRLTPLRLQQIGPFITASRTLIARVAMMAGAVEGSERAAVGAILLDLLEQDGAEIAAALAVVATRTAMAAPPADWQLYLAALRGQTQPSPKSGTSTNG